MGLSEIETQKIILKTIQNYTKVLHNPIVTA